MITQTALACCWFDLNNVGLTPPSDDALIAVIETDTELVERLNQYYSHHDMGGGGLDTVEREWLLDVIAHHFTQRAWPINADTKEVADKFLFDLIAAAKYEGWL